MAILLIRHGQTNENHARVVQMPDARLSDEGLSQACKLAEALADNNISRIISSDMTRAAQTAKAIAKKQNLPVEFTALLHERNFGDLRGREYEEIGVNFFAEDFAPPNGETWEAFFARVEEAWQQIKQSALECDGDMVVVTHGLVCRRIVERFVELNETQQLPERWDNTSVTVIEYDEPVRASIINSTAHLEYTATGGAV